jgi:hypothetical protein
VLPKPDNLTRYRHLDRLLAGLHVNKAELLIASDRPEIPLHTRGSENDIRCQVTERKVSSGTRCDTGGDCRGAFLGLTRTCAKLGIAFRDNLDTRLEVTNPPDVPALSQLIKLRLLPDSFDFCPCYAPTTTDQNICLSIRWPLSTAGAAGVRDRRRNASTACPKRRPLASQSNVPSANANALFCRAFNRPTSSMTSTMLRTSIFRSSASTKCTFKASGMPTRWPPPAHGRRCNPAS